MTRGRPTGRCIAVLRSTDVNGDSRTERVVQTLADEGADVVVIRWTRLGVETPVAGARCVSWSRPAGYGTGWVNLASLARWEIWTLGRLLSLRPTAVYACDLDAAIPAAMYSVMARAPWAFDQFDPFEGRVAGRAARGALRALESAVARMADVRVVASAPRRTGPFADATVVENAPMHPPRPPADDGRGGPADGDLGIRRRTLFYGGVLQPDRGLATAVQATLARDGWTFEAAGFGPLGDWLVGTAARHDAIDALGPLDHDELLDRMAEADLVLALYDPAVAANRATASNKLLEAAAVGVPLVAAAGTGLAADVERFGIGEVVPYDDVDALARTLDAAAARTPEQWRAIRERGQRLVDRRGWARQREHLLSVLDRLLP